ncbi:MAG: hypothetical protein CMP68_01620 [Flavobacteriales bacterium]|nr:hypothetical protein [Flavobacteriales bacterium]|tara:strand:- start:15742 stop:17805 length:2064 start_codon:yes stop_codon:yes gene_type:complete
MYKTKHIAYLFVFLFVFNGCNKDSLKTSNWNPEMVTPIANVKLTLGDLIPEEGTVIYDDDNFIRLAYREDNIFSFSSDSIIDISNQEGLNEYYDFNDLNLDDFNDEFNYTLEQVLTSDPTIQFLAEAAGIEIPFTQEQQISGGVLNILSSELDGLGQTAIELNQFNNISFITGNLSIGIQNNLPVSIENIDIDLSTGLDDIGLLQFSNIEVGETQYMSSDLSGKSIDNNIISNFIQLNLQEVDPMNEYLITPNTGIKIFFIIEDINVSNVTMSFNDQSLTDYETLIDFELENGEQIHNLELLTGKIIYNISSSIDSNLSFKLTLPSATIDGEIFESVQNISSENNSSYGEIDISDVIIDLTSDFSQPYNKIPIHFEVFIDSGNELITLTNEDYAEVNFSFSDLSIKYADGYFGDYEIDLGGDIVDIDLQIFEDFDSGLILDDPKFIIRVFNSVGVGASINAGLSAFSPNLDNAIFLFNEIIDSPSSEGGAIEQSWVYDKNNSTIENIIALPPQQIEYFGSANLDGSSSGNLNFITSDSKMTLGVEVDFPMSLNIANISLKDTIVIDEIENVNNIESLSLFMNIDNGFPLDTKLDILLRDSISNTTFDTLEIANFSSGITDDNGYLIESFFSKNQFNLNNNQIENLSKSNQLVLDVTLNTEDNKSIKLYSDYEFLVNIGMLINLNLDE